MKVLFDDQIFSWQTYGGISRYIAELIAGLELEGVEAECHVPLSDNAYYQGAWASHLFHDSSSNALKRAGKLLSLTVNRSASCYSLLRNQFDVFHPTYYNPYFLAPLRKPFVLTVYDMIHELFPEYFWDAKLVTGMKQFLCKKAHHIIAISESTKQDLIRLYNLPPEKIKVVHLAATFATSTIDDEMAPQLPENYVLFVGSRSGYKNFDTFLRAMTPLLQEEQTLHVVCTGQAFSKAETELFYEKGIASQMHQIFVQEKSFYTIYHHAKFFVFPSYYEGFGIPVLEAFLAECPTLLSQTSSLPEVGGEAALYFDPYSEKQMREQIQKVLHDAALRQRLRMAGKERVSEFSWQKTASKTAQVYLSCL